MDEDGLFIYTARECSVHVEINDRWLNSNFTYDTPKSPFWVLC